MTLFGFEKEMLIGYIASCIHECAHLWASIYLKCAPLSITFGVCAMNLETKRVTNTGKHMKILAIGPFFSFFMFGALFCLRKTGGFDMRIFEFANLCIGIANLFPATPLDGGRMLKLWMMSRFGIISGAKFMKTITNVMIMFLAIANILLLFFKGPNPFLMMFLSFLIFSLFSEKREDIVLKEMVYSGQIALSQKIKVVRFKSDCRLVDVASKISPSYYLIALIYEKDKFLGEIRQKEISPALTLFGCRAKTKDYIMYTIEKHKDLLYNK